jgi:hypothetical protein
VAEGAGDCGRSGNKAQAKEPHCRSGKKGGINVR